MAERSFYRGLTRVAQIPGMGPELAAVLRQTPLDPRAGARFSALAALVEARDELQARVAGQSAVLRRQLAFDRPLEDDQPARRIRSSPKRIPRAARNARRDK